jgi:hypothetical protein
MATTKTKIIDVYILSFSLVLYFNNLPESTLIEKCCLEQDLCLVYTLNYYDLKFL